MSRNNTWRFVVVVIVVLWSFIELYPPRGRDLVQYFRERAVKRPETAATFSNIVAKVQVLQSTNADRPYDNLVEAIGTNHLTRLFPMFADAKNQRYPTTYILNQLQRKAAGKIRLGLDLQGGTSFLVALAP